MKTAKMMLLCVLSIASASSMLYADGPSEFERGYLAGVQSCQPTGLWVCSATAAQVTACTSSAFTTDFIKTGYSKAEAQKALMDYMVNYPACEQLVLGGLTECKTL